MLAIYHQGFFSGFEEVLGKEAVEELTAAEHVEELDSGMNAQKSASLPPAFFSKFSRTLNAIHGEKSLQGLAHVAGRYAFKLYKDQLPVLVENSKIENRLLPFAEKIERVLNAFLQSLQDEEMATLDLTRIPEENAWSLKGKIMQPNGDFLLVGEQDFLMGVLESLLEWLDSRHAFQVEQKAASRDVGAVVEMMIIVQSFD